MPKRTTTHRILLYAFQPPHDQEVDGHWLTKIRPVALRSHVSFCNIQLILRRLFHNCATLGMKTAVAHASKFQGDIAAREGVVLMCGWSFQMWTAQVVSATPHSSSPHVQRLDSRESTDHKPRTTIQESRITIHDPRITNHESRSTIHDPCPQVLGKSCLMAAMTCSRLNGLAK